MVLNHKLIIIIIIINSSSRVLQSKLSYQNSLMSILNMSISTSITKSQFLSFSKSITPSNPNPLFLKFPLHKSPNQNPPKNLIIRMGGGPRTFPGGVNKWQWKRMQAKKATQLLKARLCRERQIYEMRKRAELKAAVMELEKPWEVVKRAPSLFSVKADEQLKVLADRFQRPGGFDMWSDNDGPQLFDFGGDDDLPSARFFPKGVVHSVKPYQPLLGNDDDNVNVSVKDSHNDEFFSLNSDSEAALKNAQRKVDMKNRRNSMRRFRSGINENDGKSFLPSNEGDLGLEASGANAKNYMRSSSVDSKSRRVKSSSGEFRKNGNMLSGYVDSRRGDVELEPQRNSSLTSPRRGNGDSEGRKDSSLTGSRWGKGDSERRRDGALASSRRVNGDSELRRDNDTLTSSRRGNGDSERRRDNNTLTSSRRGNGRRDNDSLTSSRQGNGDTERRRDNNTLTSSKRGTGDTERRRDKASTSSRQSQSRRDGGSVKSRGPSSEVFDMSLQRDGSYGF